MHGGKKTLFPLKNYNQRKFQEIQQPYTDILMNNKKHRENVTKKVLIREKNPRMIARNQSAEELRSGSGMIMDKN